MAGFSGYVGSGAPPASPQPVATGGFAAYASEPAPKAASLGTPPPPGNYKPPGKAWYSPVTDALNYGQKRAIGALEWASETPVARGLDAFLNADTRFGVAALAGQNPITKGVMDPAHATEMTHALEQRFHLPVAPKDANFWQNAGQFVEDFLVETAASPSTYIPLLGEAAMLKRIGQYGVAAGTTLEAARQIAKVEPVAKGLRAFAATPVARGASEIVGRARSGIQGADYDLRRDLTHEGTTIVKNEQIAGRNLQRHQEKGYAELLESAPRGNNTIAQELDGYQERMAEVARLKQEIRPFDNIPENTNPTLDAMRQEAVALEQQAKAAFPPEIRQANLQRAWREGTPEVRAIVEKKGYIPTADDREVPVLNILHHFNDEYEPTQRILSDEEKEARNSLGPVRYIRQGNKRAKFDLPKLGGEPASLLSERVLDRLVTGSRIENYHRTRFTILKRLGLMASTSSAEMEHTLELLHDARAKVASGDVASVALVNKYQAELQRQYDEIMHAEGEASRLVRPHAEWSEQKIEAMDPITARQKVLAQHAALGQPLMQVTNKGRTRVAVPIGPRDTTRDTKGLVGKTKGLRSAMIQMELVARSGRRAAAKVNDALSQRGVVAAIDTEMERAGKATEAATGKISAAADKNADLLRKKADVAKSKILKKFGAPPNPSFDPAALGASIFGPTKAEYKGKHQATPLTKPIDNIVSAYAPNTAALQTSVERIMPPEGFDNIYQALGRARKTFDNTGGASLAAHLAKTEERKQKTVGRYEESVRRVEQARAANTGVKTMKNEAEALSQAVNLVPMPAALKKHLYETFPGYNKSLAAQFSDLQRAALFILPFAHMKNITVLAALGPGGLKTVKEGWKYAHQLKTNRAALKPKITALKKIGATEHFIYDSESPYVSALGKLGPKVEDFADVGNRALENYDLGMRLALADELRRRGMSETQIGGQVRDVLGDYTDQAPLIRELRNRMGASFPAWGLGVVPRAMNKAMRENPRAVATYARANRLASDDVTEPTMHSDLDVAGPAEDYARLWERPDKFLGSPSRLGWPGALAGFASAVGHGEPLQYLAEEGLRLVPFAAPVSNLANWPFPSNAPAAARGLAGFYGSFFTDRAAVDKRARQLAVLGLKGEQIQTELRQEGYLPPLVPVPPR